MMQNQEKKYESRQQQSSNFGLVNSKGHKSPSPTGQSASGKSKMNKPILATDNFVLAHRNLIPGVGHLIEQ